MDRLYGSGIFTWTWEHRQRIRCVVLIFVQGVPPAGDGAYTLVCYTKLETFSGRIDDDDDVAV
jgi:hypothetical protein